MEKDLTKLTVRQLADGMARRVFSSEEVTVATLAAIRQRDPEIGAYLTVLEEDALAAARESDQRRSKGEELYPWTASPPVSRTTSAPRGCAPPAPPGCWSSLSRPMTPM